MKQLFCILFFLLYAYNTQSQNNYKEQLHLDYSALDSLLKVYEKQNDYEKCILIIQAGREKAKNDFGELDSVYLDYNNNLGLFYYQMGQYNNALPILKEGLVICKKTFGHNHKSTANSFFSLANLYKKMGNYNKAFALLLESKDIYEKILGKKHPDVAASLSNIAGLHQEMGNYDQALPLLLESKDIYEKALGKEHAHFASSLNNLAGLHRRIGNYDKALPLYVQAKDIVKKALGKEHPYYASSLNNLASLYGQIGNYNKALSLYYQAKEIRKKVLGEQHPDFASSLNNLAKLHERMGNPKKALPLYLQAKNIYEVTLGREHLYFAFPLSNLANVHQTIGNHNKALELYIESISIYEKILGREHTHFVTLLNKLAELHQIMRNYDKAWAVLNQAMNNSSKLSIKHSFDKKWRTSLELASYTSNQQLENMVESLDLAYKLLNKDSSVENRLNKQINIADLALELLIKVRNQLSNEKDKLRMLSWSNQWMQQSLKVLNSKEHTNKAFNLSDQNKSVLLLKATKSEQAYRLGELPDSLAWQDRELQKKQSQLQAKLVEKRPKEEKLKLRNELIKVNQEIDNFVKIIAKNYPKYHSLKYQQVNAKAEEIQALLDKNTALVEYVISDSVVHIFWVDQQQVKWFCSLVHKKELEDKIKAFHKVLSDYSLLTDKGKISYQKYTHLAHWFYQKTLALPLKEAKGIKNLIIVTDGALGHLPFETFLTKPAPQLQTDYSKLHYLLSDYNISYNYSATLWKENKEAVVQKNNQQILAMAANYEIQLDSALMMVRLPREQGLRKTLKPLPAARREVKALEEQFEGFFAFDKQASEKILKEKVSDYAVLHFATHGILDAKRPVLSSLALTEDSNPLESNFWQAHEISKMQLNANLVVLSACETGYGRFETGNGIASLARAFMYAGASSLIVSLWQVNDFSTAEIMKNLYNNLADGIEKDEALRQAKLDYIQSTKGSIAAHPAFWSSFIMMGNTQSVSIKRKGSSTTWKIGLGLLTILGIGGLFWKRKKSA